MTQRGKKILDFIQKNFDMDEEKELSEFMNENRDEIIYLCEIKEDDIDLFVDDYFYNSSSKFDNFAKEMCDNNMAEFSRVDIRYRDGYYYLSKSNYAKNSDCSLVDKYLDKLNELCESDSRDKGQAYELFCRKWLNEYCDEVKITPKSNDKGIDLIGKVTAQTSFEPLKSMCIQILAQVKFYRVKVDVPVIRHLIADSLFLSFEQGECSMFKPTLLCVISHNGFTTMATKFARDNHVFLMDSKRMISLLGIRGNLNNFECIKYLDELKI